MVAFRIAYTLSLARLGNLASGGMCGYFRYLLKCQRIFIIHHGFRCLPILMGYRDREVGIRRSLLQENQMTLNWIDN